MQSPGNQRTNTPLRMLISPASGLHGISILFLLQVLQKYQPQEVQLGPPDSPLGGQCMAVLRPHLARLMSKLFLCLWYVFSPWAAPPRLGPTLVQMSPNCRPASTGKNPHWGLRKHPKLSMAKSSSRPKPAFRPASSNAISSQKPES